MDFSLKANEHTALMTQLKFVEKESDLPNDTFERAPRSGRSTNKLQPIASDGAFFSADDIPSTTDEEQ